MARFVEPTAEQEADWRIWVSLQPEPVRSIATRFEPWSLYRLKFSDEPAARPRRVTIRSYSADGTLTVDVTGEFNEVIFDRHVFGVVPDDLEPCELPAPNEPRGTLLTPEEAAHHRHLLRVMIRPDLWEMGADGIARRRARD